MAHRNLDDIVSDTEHAQPLHPFRSLIQNHLYLDSFIEKGGMSLLLMDGLILVPVIMFAFFYPRQVLLTVFVCLLIVGSIYKSFVIWRKRHPVRH